MGIRWQITLPKLNFTQCVNQNIKVLGRKLLSPSLEDVAWLEDAQLISLIFHTFVCKMWQDGRTPRRGSREKKLQTNVWKIRKIN